MTSLRTRIEEILAYDRPLTRTDALPVWQHQVNALLDIIREQRAEAAARVKDAVMEDYRILINDEGLEDSHGALTSMMYAAINAEGAVSHEPPKP